MFFFEIFSRQILHFASSEYIHATLRVRTPAMVSITVRMVGSPLLIFTNVIFLIYQLMRVQFFYCEFVVKVILVMIIIISTFLTYP